MAKSPAVLDEHLSRLGDFLYPFDYGCEVEALFDPSLPRYMREKQQDKLDTASAMIEAHSRRYPGVQPHATKATEVLTSALCFYWETAQKKRASVKAKKAAHLSLAAALLMTVSGFTDPLQQYFFGASTFDIAKKLGLAAEWVTLRHAIAHQSLPEMETLVGACEEARLWIADVFWLRLKHSYVDDGDDTDLFEQVDPLILGKRPQAIDSMSEEELKNMIKRNLKKYTNGRVSQLRSGKSYDTDYSIDMDWAKSIKSPKGLKLLVEQLMEPRGLIPSSTIYRATGEQRQHSILFWEPLLRDLRPIFPSLRQSLFSALLPLIPAERSQDDTESEVEARQSWLEYLADVREDKNILLLRRITHPSPLIIKLCEAIARNEIIPDNDSEHQEVERLARGYVYGSEEWLEGFEVSGDAGGEEIDLLALDEVLARRELWYRDHVQLHSGTAPDVQPGIGIPVGSGAN